MDELGEPVRSSATEQPLVVAADAAQQPLELEGRRERVDRLLVFDLNAELSYGVLSYEPSQPDGVRGLVSGAELREVGTEQALQRAGAPLPVCAGRRRIQRKGQLVCHMRRERLKECAACCVRVPSWAAPRSEVVELIDEGRLESSLPLSEDGSRCALSHSSRHQPERLCHSFFIASSFSLTIA